MDTPRSPIELRVLSPRTSLSWTFVGNGIYAGIQWLMLVLLARMGLAITRVIMFSILELNKLQGSDVTNEYLFGDYLGF